MKKKGGSPVPEHKTGSDRRLNKSRQLAFWLWQTSLPEILFIASFILARWWQNSDFSYPSEIWLPLIIFSLIATIVYYVYRWLLRPGLGAHVAALILSYGLYDFTRVNSSILGHFINRLLPNGSSSLVGSLSLMVLMAALAAATGYLFRWAIKRQRHPAQLQLEKVVFFAIIFIFAIQSVKVVIRYTDIRSQLNYRYPAPSLSANQTGQPTSKPDIYYLEYEDYTDSEVLKNIYNYDSTAFLKSLTMQGFVNRQPAYSNYPVTMSSVASTLAMNYLSEFEEMFGQANKWQTGFAYRDIVKNPPVAEILKQRGYKFDMLSSWWDFTRTDIKADSNPTEAYRLDILNHHFYLSDLQRDIVNRSILSPWLKKGYRLGSHNLISYNLDNNPRELFFKQLNALNRIASRPNKSTPHFIFGFFLVPHSPYIFNPDGSPTNYDVERNDNDADENLKYRNQVEYLNKKILETVSYIKKNSPNSAIIIQSDEGSYPKEFRYELTPNHYYNPINLNLPEMRQKMAIMASYYLPGVDQKLTASQLNSSVNAFRFVLNQYLGYNLPMLPDCHFAAGDKYSLYNYQLITDRLTGQAAPAACRQYE